MNALTVQFRALQPLLVTQLGAGEENGSTAFSFIPGSVLRGVVIDRYLQKHRLEDPAQDSVWRHLFFDGAVRYLNAYPVNRLGKRTLPKPLSWRVSKDDRDNRSATVYDFAIERNEDVDNPVSPSGVFCWRDENAVEIGEPGRYVNVHNASENRHVKRKEDSTVYRYEAIAAGELFSAVILADDKADLQALRPLLEEAKLNLGGSRSAGYGLVQFENFQLVPDWQEYAPDDDPDEDIVVLTLLSDAILRDQNGQFTTDLDGVLGAKHHLWAYLRMRVVGGFNRKWGLPLVQTPALQAGSVFVYPADEVDQPLLRKLEREGIGERRVEGFGRTAINWHTQAMLQRRFVREDALPSPISLSDESQELAQRMAQRRLRAVLDRKLLEALSRLEIARPPSNAQLSRLRTVVRRAWRGKNRQVVIDHMKDLKSTARDQFVRAKIDGQRLMNWVVEGAEKEKIWTGYIDDGKWQIPEIAGVSAQVDDTLKIEYSLRLLDALLQRAAKQRVEGGAG